MAVGLPTPATTFAVSSRPSRYCLATVPRPRQENEFILSGSLAPLQSLSTCHWPADRCTSFAGSPSQGFFPLRDIHTRSPLDSGFPDRLCSTLAVSHDLDGLLLRALCGFVSPHCHVQDSRFRGFPSDSVKPGSSPGRSLSTLTSFASLWIAPPVPARPASPSGRYSKPKSVARTKRFRPRSNPIPSYDFTPSGFCRAPWPCLHSASAHDLSDSSLTVTRAAGLQRLISFRRSRPVPRTSSRSSLSPFRSLPPK
jgi:hypothetical protein